MLWASLHHGHTAIVLGAYGCGAFKNDPNRVAQLFWTLLGPGGEFEGRFGVVIFAIMKSRDNMQAFSSVFPWMRRIPQMEFRSQAQPAMQASPFTVSEKASTLTDSEKQVLKLAKKIREAVKLEESLDSGKILEEGQHEQLKHKAEWIEELGEQMASLPGDSAVPAKIQDVLDHAGG